jgi:ABC-type uncharacterized transport system permease subunit
MSPPHVVIRADKRGLNPIAATAPQTAWKALGRVGLLLAIIGGIDIVLHWYPAHFRSPEWEFGTVATTFASLPLVTLGLVAGLASALARGVRGGISVMAIVFTLMAVFSIGMLLLFASDVPLALKAVQQPGVQAGAATEIKKTIARAGLMGLGFLVIYVYGSALSFRYLFRRIRDV